jgi:uncharacterized protein YoxC
LRKDLKYYPISLLTRRQQWRIISKCKFFANSTTAHSASEQTRVVLGAQNATTGLDSAVTQIGQQTRAAVQEVSASAEEMSAQVEQVTASAQALQEMAQSLQMVIGQFKLNQTGSSPTLSRTSGI